MALPAAPTAALGAVPPSDLDTASGVQNTLQRAVAEAADKVRRDEALVTERVAAARARGRSWNKIAVALGVSRQAARHRFADKVG